MCVCVCVCICIILYVGMWLLQFIAFLLSRPRLTPCLMYYDAP